MIWELITGLKPTTKLEDVVAGTKPEISAEKRKLFPHLVIIFDKCTQINPSLRPSAKQLLELLRG
jgi:hypothetical protein